MSISDKNEPFRKWINFDKSFNRTEQGTDINIAGVYEIPELNKKLIVAILDSFLYAIYKQTLSIDVNGIIISKKSLGTIMRRYEDDIDQTTNEIHNLLVNKNTFVYQKNVVDKTNSDVEIRIILEDDSSRKISMIRNPWMKITNMDRFPRLYQFSGMIIIKGRELNELLRKAENPQHNDWEPDRIDNNIQLKNRIIETLSSMHKIVRELLDELYQEDLDEYLDIFGAEDYIEMIDTTGNKKIQGKVKEPVKKIGVREKKINSDGKKIINFDEDETVIELDGDYEVLGDAEPDPKRQKSKNKHDFIIQRIKKNGKKVKLEKSKLKLISLKKEEGINRLIIYLDYEINVNLQVLLLDEQSSVIKNMIQIQALKINGEITDKFIDDFIFDVTLKKGMNFIDVKLNLIGYVSIGVDIFET